MLTWLSKLSFSWLVTYGLLLLSWLLLLLSLLEHALNHGYAFPELKLIKSSYCIVIGCWPPIVSWLVADLLLYRDWLQTSYCIVIGCRPMLSNAGVQCHNSLQYSLSTKTVLRVSICVILLVSSPLDTFITRGIYLSTLLHNCALVCAFIFRSYHLSECYQSSMQTALMKWLAPEETWFNFSI